MKNFFNKFNKQFKIDKDTKKWQIERLSKKFRKFLKKNRNKFKKKIYLFKVTTNKILFSSFCSCISKSFSFWL